MKTAYITGGSSGIGEALAVELAGRGYGVVVGARRRDELDRVVGRILSVGGEALGLVVDVGNAQAARDAVAEAQRWRGQLDLVVANAGIGKTLSVDKLEWADAERMIDVNITGAFATLMAAVPGMVARRSGQLAGVSSLAGYRALPMSACYSATKAALSVFLEGMRLDLRDHGIGVTAIYPGFVRTPMTAKNRFPMPFLVDVEPSAKLIADALERGQDELAFPLPTAAVAGLGRFLPGPVYAQLMRLMRPAQG